MHFLLTLSKTVLEDIVAVKHFGFCWISEMFCFHRDIYYNNTQLFGSQTTVDSIVDDISCMLKVPRRSLHVVSVHVQVYVKDGLHDCGIM